jgi:MYXO-CTERM domain-containing protein
LTGSPGRLLVSTDSGKMWSEAFKGMGILKGFALSPDGKIIAVGGEGDGIWRAPTDTLQFEQRSKVGVQCLAWSTVGLYACAGEFKASFTVGLSTDEGASFTPVMHLACVRGPLMCGPETDVGQQCPSVWPATADLIDQPSCMPDAGGGGSGGGGGGTDGGTPDAGPGSGGGGGKGDEGGCGCHTASPDSPGWGALLLGLGLIGAARRARTSSRRGGRGSQPPV